MDKLTKFLTIFLKTGFVLTVLTLFLVPATWSDTKAEWRNGVLCYFDSETLETLDALAPTKIFDDCVYSLGLTDAAEAYFDLDAVNSGTVLPIASQDGGIVRLTCGGADNDDAEWCSELIWKPSLYCSMEARIRSSTSTMGFNVGFNDTQTEDADKLAVTFSGTTITTNTTDGALFFKDSDSTSDLIRSIAVKNDSDGTTTSTGTTFAADTWYTFRVDINGDGDVSFWFNGDHIYTEEEGITTTTALCTYVGVINRQASAATLDVDYVRVWQKR